MNGQRLVPLTMVTHTWENLFVDLIAGVVADALDTADFETVVQRLQPSEIGALASELWWKGRLDKSYWICALCLNQHASICHEIPQGYVDPVTQERPAACNCEHRKYHNQTAPLNSDGHSILCEMNKFDDMMARLGESPDFVHVIAVDRKYKLFTR